MEKVKFQSQSKIQETDFKTILLVQETNLMVLNFLSRRSNIFKVWIVRWTLRQIMSMIPGEPSAMPTLGHACYQVQLFVPIWIVIL